MGKALPHTDTEQFINRHIGPRPADIEAMLETLGFNSLDALIARVVPEDIRLGRALDLPPAAPEHEVLAKLSEIAKQNEICRSFIGMGYANCITPAVIRRNILESPGWYTAYTPYQAEIAQGRLEALLNFQTMVSDLTGLEIANASLLDEATAAAEAMTMTVAATKPTGRTAYLADQNCHPQTIAVLETRAKARRVELRVGNPHEFEFTEGVIGALVQYPGSDGALTDPTAICDRAHAAGALVTVATDLLGLTLLKSPGELGADVAIGNSQRFGVPLGYGGPHAAFFATRTAYKRLVPGRIIGVSRDSAGNPALRMTLQTREQHIRRDKATSNICTAQVLLAVIAGAYATYHGPEGLVRIARRVHALTVTLAELLKRLGHNVLHNAYFDTLCVKIEQPLAAKVLDAVRKSGINLRDMHGRIGISLDEIATLADVSAVAAAFRLDHADAVVVEELAEEIGNKTSIPASLRRSSSFLTHPVFHRYRSETEMLRYLKKLESRDLSLTSAMIPLGSCTMKLNATVEMIPITWPEFANIHPFAPREQAKGYQILFDQLETQLAEISGLPHTSLQPNAGSQGEFSGLLTIKAYHQDRGEAQRSVCLIPTSAHGTNPASAVMADLEIVAVATDEHGNIDVADLRAKAQEHRNELAALMVTYPSTHGVFESTIREVCEIIHENGGQVYMDGANLNAQVGLCRPGDVGADVCHINLHKTFCIPHGGGGPGMGPICAADHLGPFLPDHPVIPLGHERSCGTISAAPWGSPSILPISWAYLALTGPDGQKTASEIAILNANYMARRLQDHFPLVYSGKDDLIAHECIVDGRPFKASAGVDVADIATRLMDYGFHAPTVSWPVHGTLMIEPTESESKEELDRFCDAMISIREEIREIEDGRADREINLLRMSPHTLQVIASDDWDRPYSRERAAFPSRETRDHKSWPAVGRVDGAYGDRNLVCTRPPVAAHEDATESVGV